MTTMNIDEIQILNIPYRIDKWFAVLGLCAISRIPYELIRRYEPRLPPPNVPDTGTEVVEMMRADGFHQAVSEYDGYYASPHQIAGEWSKLSMIRDAAEGTRNLLILNDSIYIQFYWNHLLTTLKMLKPDLLFLGHMMSLNDPDSVERHEALKPTGTITPISTSTNVRVQVHHSFFCTPRGAQLWIKLWTQTPNILLRGQFVDREAFPNVFMCTPEIAHHLTYPEDDDKKYPFTLEDKNAIGGFFYKPETADLVLPDGRLNLPRQP